ncbi:cell wall-binding repeat-containing protein [Laceyella putida]|uniref:Cell wall-binding repeat-containing protein n=1 Tax=Laceyella putida TaxID=110101 RepID=A0ABW2RFK7_9BACL
MRKKFLTGVLATAVISSLLVQPALTDAAPGKKVNLADEIENSLRIKTQHKLETYLQGGGASVSSKTVRSMASTTQATVANTLKPSAFHSYKMVVTTGGTLNITEPASEEYGYVVFSEETGEEYFSGDTIPAGTYHLLIFSMSDAAVSYSMSVSGVTMNIDTVLPALNVTSPNKVDYRLAKNTTALTLSGSATGADNTFYAIDDSEDMPFNSTSFNKTITASLGHHGVDLGATTASGNMVVHSYFVTAPGLKRIAGADRYAVSANVSKEAFPYGADTVVIARGDLYTDALAGGPLAAMNYAPMLLTTTNALPAPVSAEIKRLQPSRAIILGGTGSVSTGVENTLKSMGMTVERIAGADRFVVSTNIASRMKADGFETDTAIIASGLNYPDALSASSPAGQIPLPILEVSKDSIPASVDSYIKANGIKNFIIVGGPGTVSDTVKNKLASFGGQVDRIGGANRFEVGVNIANYFLDGEYGMMFPSTIVFATGLDFPDAISGSPMAANMYSPMLLTYRDKLDPMVKTYLETTVPSITTRDVFYLIGNTTTVNSTVETYLKGLID